MRQRYLNGAILPSFGRYRFFAFERYLSIRNDRTGWIEDNCRKACDARSGRALAESKDIVQF